jgi:hypothetical protein
MIPGKCDVTVPSLMHVTPHQQAACLLLLYDDSGEGIASTLQADVMRTTAKSQSSKPQLDEGHA